MVDFYVWQLAPLTLYCRVVIKEHAIETHVRVYKNWERWYEIWMNACKKNCRSSTKDTYASHYRRIQKELGWIKLTNLNLIVLQKVFNELRSDNERKNSNKILADMLEKAIDAELLIKNVAKQINTRTVKRTKRNAGYLLLKKRNFF